MNSTRIILIIIITVLLASLAAYIIPKLMVQGAHALNDWITNVLSGSAGLEGILRLCIYIDCCHTPDTCPVDETVGKGTILSRRIHPLRLLRKPPEVKTRSTATDGLSHTKRLGISLSSDGAANYRLGSARFPSGI